MRSFGLSRLVIALVGGVLLVGAATTVSQPCSGSDELARRVGEAWSSGDRGIVDEVFAEDGVHEDAAAGRSWEGREAIKAAIDENFRAVPDFEIELTNVLSTGDGIACEWIMSGTQTGDYPGLPATGKSFSVRGASLAKVRDGQIVRWTDYYDGLSFLQQLGAVPLPSSSGESDRGD